MSAALQLELLPTFTPADLPANIARRVEVTADGCWEWQAALDAYGYGAVRHGGRVRKVHRLAYESVVGPIPDGLFVCHHCDNRRCCNPSHLFLGTNADNMADKIAKGRQHLVYPDEVVRAARDLCSRGVQQRDVAAHLGVSQSVVSNWHRGAQRQSVAAERARYAAKHPSVKRARKDASATA